MTAPLNQSVLKAGRILEVLVDAGFQPKTLDEIFDLTDIPWSTAYRLLKSLEALGWVVEIPAQCSRQVAWKLSTKLAAIAAAYEQHSLARIHRVQREFQQVTGRELNV